jgi:hypothetical protein
LLTWQILLPGFIGLANNGDFPKVAGRLSLGGADGSADNFLYFEPDYLREPRWYWNSELPASELLLAWISTVIPSAIQKHLRDPREFDIRWLGALHVLLWMGGYSLLLRWIRSLNGILWWIAALASFWIFMDVSYVAYFNSFYTDTAALLGVMAAISLVPILLAQSGAVRTGAIVSFGAGALLYVTSKGQHAAFAPILAALSTWIAWIAARKSAKIAASATAVALMCGSIWAFVGTPSWYRSQSRFNLIFARILPESANPAQDAQELGLAPADLRYIGMQSFLPGTPVDNPQWLAGFTHRGGNASVLRFYLRHPAVPFRYLWNDLRIEAAQMRALNLSNFQRRDGRPAGAKTNRMASWSNLRSWLLARWPIHLVVWYGLVLLGLPPLLRGNAVFRDTLARPAGWSAVFAAVMGIGEFLVASLTDCLETYRHLLLFHLFTDFTIFFTIVLMLRIYARPIRLLLDGRPHVRRNS